MAEGLLYELTITVDMIHNWKTQTQEIYLPDYGIFFNNLGGCNKNDGPRCDKNTLVTPVTIDDEKVKVMRQFVESKESLTTILRDYFGKPHIDAQ